MSDFEGDWEPAEKRNKLVVLDYAPAENLGLITPHGRTFNAGSQPKHNRNAVKDRLKRQRQQTLPASYRPGLQRQGLPEHHGVNGNQADNIQTRVGELSSFHKYKSNRGSPDGTHEMMHPWGEFLRAFRRRDVDVNHAATNRLAQICIGSGAFIEVPAAQDTHVLKLWGTPEQVKKAKGELHAWEMLVKGPGVHSKDGAWVKTNALDGRSEYRQIREQNRQADFEAAQEGGLNSGMPHQAQLFWPSGYDLEKFITDYDGEAISRLCVEMDCSIVHDKSTRTTLVAAYYPNQMYAAYNRLINLTKEMTVRKKEPIRSNLCYLPSKEVCRDHVKLLTIGIIGTKIHLPMLTGANLPRPEFDEWTELRTRRSQEHSKAIKHYLRSSLRALQFAQKHARMRVTFGDIGLLRYKKANSAAGEYTIDEFVPMIQSREIEVRQCPLRTESTAANIMLNKISESNRFGNPKYTWAVHFDFHGTSGANNNILRLETEFTGSPDEPQKDIIRWLEFRSNQTQDPEKPLELNAVDFEVIGFQFQINAINVFTNNKVLDDLENFVSHVKFSPPAKGLQYTAEKRSSFPFGQRELRNVHEITIAQYPLAGSEGILEIRRIDHFPQGPGQASKTPAWTEWTAAYFYHGWDALMSQFGRMKPGNDVQWKKDLTTFFPRKKSEDSLSLPKGFKAFMKEVQEIQTILAEATGKKQVDLMDMDG